MVSVRIIGFINAAVLSGYSEYSVAAVTSANSVINLFPIAFSVICTGATVTTSKLLGGEQLKKAYNTNFTQMALCIFIGALCSIVSLVFAPQIMGFMNLEPTVHAEALSFYKIRVSTLVIVAASSGFSAILRCFGHAKSTVIIHLTTVILSMLLNVFVIKCPNLSPVTGADGIACGTVISQIVGLLLNIFVIWRKKIAFLKPRLLKDFFGYAKQILGIGLPSGISSSTFTLSQIISTSFIALLGTLAISSKAYYDNILCYAYLFSISIGNANSLLIGRIIGAGEVERAKKLNATIVKMTVSVNFIISLLILILHKPLVSIFTDNPDIIKTAVAVFAIDIIAELSRGVSQVYEYALRAAGDMKFMLVVLMISCWVFGVGLSYFLALPCGLGIVGCFIGVSCDEFIRAVASVYRWRSEKWNKVKRD